MNRVVLWSLLIVLVAPAGIAVTSVSDSQDPSPVLNEIRIYDVTGVDQGLRETGGTLKASGVNTTFTLRQQATERRYRFEFEVENTDNSKSWQLEQADAMFHDGINQNWNVTKVWYNLSQDYDGGTNSTNVTWNTGNGGTVSPGEIMHAKYLVNISKDHDGTYSQQFVANDTSNEAWTTDYHQLEVQAVGSISVSMTEPPNDTIVQQNKLFDLSSTISCTGGVCGDVNVTARYNTSTTANTLLPESSSSPFFIDSGGNKRACGLLTDGDTCSITWAMNATGAVESAHSLDANTTSNASRVEDAAADDVIVEINDVILMDLTFDTVDFGVLDPGTDSVPATENDGLSYNISFSSNSNTVEMLSIKASPLVNQVNDGFSIGPSNVTVSRDGDNQNYSLSESFTPIKTGITPPANISTYYWLDVPLGVLSGEYEGNLTVKANRTG